METVSSFEPGSIMRWAIIASTMSRSGQGLDDTRSRMPSRLIAVRTALTWPHGRDDSTSKRLPASTRCSPLSAARSAATASGGSIDRFASVRLTVRPPSR